MAIVKIAVRSGSKLTKCYRYISCHVPFSVGVVNGAQISVEAYSGVVKGHEISAAGKMRRRRCGVRSDISALKAPCSAY